MRGGEERTGLVRRTTNADQYRRRWLDRTPTMDISRFGWPDRIHFARNRRYASRSRQHIHVSTRTHENSERKRKRHWRRYTGGACEQLAPFSLQPGGRIPERHVVTPSSNTYPFRSYVETLLSYGAEAKKTQLISQLWCKDTAGHVEGTIVNAGNLGLVERGRYLAESRAVDMMGRLHVDLFLQDRFLLNGVDVKIRLVRSWWLMSEPRVQSADSGSHTVHMQGRVESDRSDGLQCLLHTTRRHVPHSREPLPRDVTETTHLVVYRQ